MSEGVSDLWQGLSVLADEFAGLGRRMLNASRRLHTPGELPARALETDLARLRRSFRGLRAQVIERAAAVGVRPLDEAKPDNLKTLAEFLLAVEKSEEGVGDGKLDWDLEAAAAFAVLDRVLALRCFREPAAGALRECQEEARELRDLLTAEHDEDSARLVDELVAGEHPFCGLLAIIEGQPGSREAHLSRVIDSLGEPVVEAALAGLLHEENRLPTNLGRLAPPHFEVRDEKKLPEGLSQELLEQLMPEWGDTLLRSRPILEPLEAPSGRRQAQLLVAFGTELDPASAANLANYRLIDAAEKGREIGLRSANYNPGSRTVTLVLSDPWDIHTQYQLRISGLRRANGQPLDRAGDSSPAGTIVTGVVRRYHRHNGHESPAGPARDRMMPRESSTD